MTATGDGEAPVRILIVDNDRFNRSALCAALDPLGFTLVEADSGVAALRQVMADDFAVILLDVFMPDMDGFETAALIRQRRQSELTPIIFITAAGEQDLVRQDRLAEGAVDFMFAPVNPVELRAKITVFAKLFVTAEALASQIREAQASIDHLDLVTDVAPIGIFQTDTDHRYVYTNPRWSEITGIPPQEAIGRALDTVIGTEVRQDFLQALNSPGRRGAEFSYRFEIVHPDSGLRMATMTAVAIPNSKGGTSGLIGIVADVTAEATAEAAMADANAAATSASQFKSDFLANMSHEIRTPMNGVIGMTDLLLETQLDGRQRDYAQTVRNSGEALLAIINDILDFSKVEAGMLEMEDTDYSVGIVIDNVLDLLASSAQAKGIELVASVDPSVPPLIRGDSGRLRQVLMNLVGNAIKFTQSGNVTVRASVDGSVKGDGFLRFAVTDTGVGIAPDKIGAIFQPFVQADTSTSRRFGGTGLGLAISGQLITLMGGDFGVSSKPSEGSAFWFTIRIRPAETSAPSETPDHCRELTGLTALVVDDSAPQRDVLSDYLTGWGMTVTTSETGESGLAVMQSAALLGAPFSLALIDRTMPGMGGLELRERLTSGPTVDTPLVLMIGIGDEHDLTDRDKAGFRGLLGKPVHQASLLDCVHSALELGETQSAAAETRQAAPDVMTETTGGRLLLAEDNLINRKVALAMLSSAGYHVDTVFDGFAAVVAVSTKSYDAILMDCQMPGMNGYEATAAIRDFEGDNRHTPVIALTAGARTQDKERCLSGGMDGYLAKPISKDALLSVVASFVQTGNQADALR
jgi:two-component system sensor histidine kinase/response regulator